MRYTLFLSVGLFLKADNLWQRIAAGTGGILAFSAFGAVYHNERPFVTRRVEYTGFLTGLVGIILVVVVNSPWLKIILGIGAVVLEVLTFAFFAEKATIKTPTPQKRSTSIVPQPTKQPLELEKHS